MGGQGAQPRVVQHLAGPVGLMIGVGGGAGGAGGAGRVGLGAPTAGGDGDLDGATAGDDLSTLAAGEGDQVRDEGQRRPHPTGAQ